ncbi:MAG: T9SS type A sorting domain-containing protein [Flavobacteriaceae bacterium]|nr:T9SS type A sorting domain-containing protein [Bacteroidia bacterium]NNF73996.1 T9SS type A sorting domain-containing protein [Flavobacteriaceae bacterium]
MKKLYILLLTVLIGSVALAQPVINEVDADTPGTDMAEFVELLWSPSQALDGYTIVFYNGNGDISYAAFDLDGLSTDINGFLILGNDGLPDEEVAIGVSNSLQNGADAVALYLDDATSFPNGTPITATNLIGGVVYDTNDADDAGLLAIIGGVQYNEDENTAKDTQSIQRKMDGTYEVKNITYRADNSAATCDLSITGNSATCDNETVGVDTYTATFDFTGGGAGMGTYSVTSDVGSVDLSGGDPDVDVSGTISVTGINEGTDVTLTIMDAGVCNLMDTASSPTCEPAAILPLFDDFTYPDGSLVPNGGWASHSGTLGDLLVSSGQAVVQHGAPSEDVNLAFAPVAGNVYFGIDVTVNDQGTPIPGTDNEYFAHFKDSGFNFAARLDIVPPTGGGDFTFGISSANSTADAVWATDLSYGVSYRVIVRYNQDENIAELWIDASSESDTSILGIDEANPGDVIESFALRQSDSDLNESILVDNLVVSETFNEATLSIGSLEANSFKLYPNPNRTGTLMISTVDNTSVDVEVYDVLGKRVLSATAVDSRLDVSNLKSGLYLVKLSQGNSTITKKLIIE